MDQLIKAAWRYRHFIVSSIRADFRARFGRSRLGAAWMILQPLAQAAIFAYVLSEILSSKLPGIDNKFAYPIYLLSGTLAWTLFSEVLNKSVNVFVDNAGLLKKISFPRVCLPVIAAGVAVANSVLLFVAICAVFLVLGHGLTLTMLWLLPVGALIVIFALGLGLLLGVLNVFMRDVGQIVPVIMQLWFWLTPIVYMSHILPSSGASLLKWNLMYPPVYSFQQIMLYGKAPDPVTLVPLLLVGSVLLAIAYVLFLRASPEMVDEL
ncbi:ABC transporter permease [Lysobacter arvi]|uniref:Transport permease protein n=1 Tax=Lysobacter arvi TaxID=3038776 RepID=A0ABU1CFB4_9GAMM|nr:ABC transporter permease [Lysobacter arvi]MDR0183640.1 ABC transporter permease [Lysobacter arvi]